MKEGGRDEGNMGIGLSVDGGVGLRGGEVVLVQGDLRDTKSCNSQRTLSPSAHPAFITGLIKLPLKPVM